MPCFLLRRLNENEEYPLLLWGLHEAILYPVKPETHTWLWFRSRDSPRWRVLPKIPLHNHKIPGYDPESTLHGSFLSHPVHQIPSEQSTDRDCWFQTIRPEYIAEKHAPSSQTLPYPLQKYGVCETNHPNHRSCI